MKINAVLRKMYKIEELLKSGYPRLRFLEIREIQEEIQWEKSQDQFGFKICNEKEKYYN